MSPRVVNHRRVAVARCGTECRCAGKVDDPAFACPVALFSAWYGDNGATPPPEAVVRVVSAYDGSAKWASLHRLAFNDEITREWLDEWAADLPLLPCTCKRDWIEGIKDDPLPLVNQLEWSLRHHNRVNAFLRARGLDRPDFTLSQARDRWKPD